MQIPATPSHIMITWGALEYWGLSRILHPYHQCCLYLHVYFMSPHFVCAAAFPVWKLLFVNHTASVLLLGMVKTYPKASEILWKHLFPSAKLQGVLMFGGIVDVVYQGPVLSDLKIYCPLQAVLEVVQAGFLLAEKAFLWKHSLFP